MRRTLWGVTSMADASHPPSVPLLEIQVDEPRSRARSPELVLRFNHWTLAAQDLPEHHERVAVLLEAVRSCNATTASLSVPNSLQTNAELPSRIRSLTERASAQGTDLYFDFGRSGPPKWAEPERCVADPLWFQDRPWSDFWKIHGWHLERWVRRYSPGDLDRLVRLAGRYFPKFVILGHSQRCAQWEELPQKCRSAQNHEEKKPISSLATRKKP